jgi:RNA polymerase sigma-70 factor (ECF subfamily)
MLLAPVRTVTPRRGARPHVPVTGRRSKRVPVFVRHLPGRAPSTADLARRIRDGDPAALETLFHEHYAALCRFANRYLHDRAAAEDLVQDVFASIWAGRLRLDVRGSLRSYLFAAVRNRALNLRKHQLVERDWERDEALPDVRALHRAPPRPDDLLDDVERRNRLRAALDALPERCRLVMQLRWEEQLTHAEIAEVLGITVKGVERQLARGLRTLRDRARGDLR